MIIIQNNTSKVEYAYLVVVVECVHMGGGELASTCRVHSVDIL